MQPVFDVLIIGGGVIGSAIARELTRYRLKTGVLEKNLDVCGETSGRNSAVIHGGFAYDPGTLKARLCVEGNRMMDTLSQELGFAFLRCGKVLVGNTPEDLETLRRTMAQGEQNGASGLELVDEKRLHELVPAVVGKFAMYSKNSGIVDPFGFTVALAENAHVNGAEYFFDSEVTAIRREDGLYRVTTRRGVFSSRWVFNAAGLGCKQISDMLGITGYRVIGSKGDYLILDKRMGELLPMPVYPVPSNTYMGIHVTNTIDGNVTVGPDAELTEDFADYGVAQRNIDYLAESASRLWPHIHKKDYIRNYSGILPRWVDENGVIQDFKIEIRDDIAPNAVNLVGIESPGLTAAVSIARYAISLMAQREELKENPAFNPIRRGIVRLHGKSPEEKAALIRENPDYGEVVCRCEQVSRAEILQAIHNPLGVHTMAGIKYRTRSMMGRCQGGYCQMRVTQMIQQELDIPETEILHSRQGSYLFSGKVREDRREGEGVHIRKASAVIAGGGPAGLAAAVALYDKGIRDIVVLEREKYLGGILRQCIHDGFGLTRFGETLSGPEYARRFIDGAEKRGILCLTDTSVLNISPQKVVTSASRDGITKWQADAVILAMGCRERTRGALAIPGDRPSGVFTAGVVQSYINLYNRMPGKEAVILGSGDIGMIMARRLTLEGAHVQGVFEIQPYPSGLPRNIRQCLEDYDIPLHLSRTVTEIHGRSRLTGVTVSQVDEHLHPIPGTEEEIPCDMLVLSVGLIPENELSLEVGIALDNRTKGAMVDEFYQTEVPGIFAAGNVLHVHDVVDYVSLEAERLADAAAMYLREGALPVCGIPVVPGEGIGHTIPQRISGERDTALSLRVSRPAENAAVTVRQRDCVLAVKRIKKVLPAEMIEIKLKAGDIRPGIPVEVTLE